MAQVNAAWIVEVTDDTVISSVDDEIRDTRQAVHERLAKEHVTYADSSSTGLAAADGYHLSGSAKAYADTSAPTTRPNGVSLTSADKGRIWINETADTSYADDLQVEMKYYHPTYGWKPANHFSDKVFFPSGVSIGGVDVSGGTDFSGFLGVNSDNQVIGFSGDLELSSTRGIIPTTDGESHLGTSDNSFGSIYGDAVYGAVGNDIADEIDGVVGVPSPGRCYVVSENGVSISRKRAEKGTIGVCSDTASLIARNKHVTGGKIQIAVAGFPLACVDREYPPGTPLVSGPRGTLTKAPWLVRVLFPERVVGTFHRKPGLFWGQTPTAGRSIIKVG